MALQVREVVFGEGIPKICVPVMGVNGMALLPEVLQAKDAGADLVEWRADFFNEATNPEAVKDTLPVLRTALGDTPLLFTFRTAREGGNREVSEEYYIRLVKEVAASGLCDLVDFELGSGEGACRELVEAAHQSGVKVILSNHDFEKTPPEEELLRRLCAMREMGADMPKIAAMPKTKADVLAMLSATVKMGEQHPECPVITMSMGRLGVISRVAGSFSGSALTFGTAGSASAPGQPDARELRRALALLG